jgi:23S rRNA (pseudouridine1915-N3)-methyltransferase
VKLSLLLVGETDDSELKGAIERYVDRLKHYCSFEVDVLKSPKQFKKLGQTELKVAEGKLILDSLSNQDFVVLLDELGTEFSSVKFSEKLQKWLNAGHKRIVFVVGGAFGFSDEVYARANFKMGLSQMTLTHQMVRLFFAEQLYRAFTILRNEKYHH